MSNATATLSDFGFAPRKNRYHSHEHDRNSSPPASPSCDDREGHYKYRIGEYLDDRYKVIRTLGEGTFGKVVEAWDRHTDTTVAIKIIRAVEKYRDAARTELRILHHLNRRDPSGSKGCVRLLGDFDYRNHVCMVFEKLGPSLYDFLKSNRYRPFPVLHVQHFARNILQSVAFLHDELELIHTDLKPENLLLVTNDFFIQGSKKVPASTDIKLIDFGSATYNSHHHTHVVSTRHYRAPEVILGLGWTYPCDSYSVGCILVEMYTGETLFQTHDNGEHLAMMERVFGPIPRHMKEAAEPRAQKYFKRDLSLRWPEGANSESVHAVRKCRSLEQLLGAEPLFLDLITRLTAYEPDRRITPRTALDHPFLRSHEPSLPPPYSSPPPYSPPPVLLVLNGSN
eukprot:gnl/Spiro4/7771_TR4089_c0_g2_i1.p1 gnl/Spiro4/7771_TR4089_c0_g2~~gnl/Spiro4/7771_TR4089_c0_g2_i1.p1  ORF type:complete len:397 (+),score=73.04 gnl/Spiro4/7771_TR4089_c0_g2_i1:287-1477(+)